MAQKYRKIDPRVISDQRFLELFRNRWDRSAFTNLPLWPYREHEWREHHARRVSRYATKNRAKLLAALIAERGKSCVECGRRRVFLCIDHVLPATWGGTNDLFNLQLLCVRCNSSKGNKLPQIEELSHA